MQTLAGLKTNLWAIAAAATFFYFGDLAEPAKAVTFTDFGFASGSPVSGSTTLAGVNVNFSSTNTGLFPDATTGTQVLLRRGQPSSTAQFSFDKNITEFFVNVSFLNRYEFVSFNLGSADTLTNFLVNIAPGVTCGKDRGDCSGQIGFSGLNTNFVSLSYSATGRSGGNATLDSFGITPVPLPATLPLLGAGLGLIGLAGWWQRRRMAGVTT